MSKKKKEHQIAELISVCEKVVHSEEIKKESNNTEKEYSYTEQEASNIEGIVVLEEGTVAVAIEENTVEENNNSIETMAVDRLEEISTPIMEGSSENYDINGNPVENLEDLPFEVQQDFTEEFPTLQTVAVEGFDLGGFDYVPTPVEQDVIPMPEDIEDPIINPLQVELTREEVEEANRANNESDESIAEEEVVSQKQNYVPETSLPELEIVPLEDENQPYGKDKSTSGEISSAMEEDEETVVVSEKEDRKPKMKIKEIKYGMTVIANLGNYENIRTHIEATAEIEENEDLVPSIKELSSHIRKIGREEYRVIKEKTIAKEQKDQQSKQSYVHTGNQSQLGTPKPQQPNQQTTGGNYPPRNNQNNYPPRNNQPNYPPAQHGQRTQKAAPPSYNQNQPFNPNNRY